MRYRMMVAVGLLGLAAPAWADVWDFILINNAGKDIAKVELSPAGTGTWEPNIIDADSKAKTIKVGGRSTVHFDKTAAQCKFEVKATFADDTTAVFPAVNVCDASFVTISYKNGAPASSGN